MALSVGTTAPAFTTKDTSVNTGTHASDILADLEIEAQLSEFGV